jgi:hypothetical protein
MNKIYAGQIEAFDPTQRALNEAGGQNVLSLLKGEPLPGYLSKLPGGIDEATTADIANRSVKDIQPFFQSSGLLDSGVNAMVSGRTAGDIRRQTAEFNINNLMQLLNIGVGGQAQVQQPMLQTQSTYSSALAGLRTASSTGSTTNQSSYRYQQPFAQTFQQLGSGFNSFRGSCWVAAELFGGWDNIKTHLTRYFISNMAPKWFRELYMKHGEQFAEFIHDKPVIKAFLRPLFEVFAFLGDCGVREVCHG